MFYTALDKSDYFDLVVTKDCRDFYRDYNECKLININVTEDLCSIPGGVQTGEVELKNITLTGYDNFFIYNGVTFNTNNFTWNTATVAWLNANFSWLNDIGDGTTGYTVNNNTIIDINNDLTYIIESGDTFCFHEISGYSGNYCYEINHLELDNGVYYNKLNGGFYQGFYKIFGQNVEWFPARAKKGWTVDMVVHFPMDLSGTTSGTTSGETCVILNDIYPNNSGFIFYIGTRAENKFADQTTIEVQRLETEYSVTPLNTNNLYTYNSLITLDGLTNYIGYFNYYNGLMYTGRNYTTDSQPLQYHQKYGDLTYNAFGIRVTNDGKIGYRTIYPTDVCYSGATQEVSGITNNSFIMEPDDPCVNYTKALIVTKYFTIEECYTKKPIINVSENKFLNITGVFERDFAYGDNCQLKYGDYKKGSFSIYLNGFLVFRNKNFIEVMPHELDTDSKYQEGVPFNISFGGGTQNLMDFISLDNTKHINTVLEKFFAGTFLGGVKSFKMHCVPLYTVEVKKEFRSIADMYDLPIINGGRQIFIKNLF
jgi:hypothetical protein